MKYKEVIKLLEKDGWSMARQKGSHRVYKHPARDGIVVVAGHRMQDEVPPGTLNSIMKQAGLK